MRPHARRVHEHEGSMDATYSQRRGGWWLQALTGLAVLAVLGGGRSLHEEQAEEEGEDQARPAGASCHHVRYVLVSAWDRIESSVVSGSTSLEPHGHQPEKKLCQVSNI